MNPKWERRLQMFLILCIMGLCVYIGSMFNRIANVQALEPEFKIFSVCLEDQMFAVAMKTNAISITPIMNRNSSTQMRCK
jgi:hypothetical protein